MNRTPDIQKLLQYGFVVASDDSYTIAKSLNNSLIAKVDINTKSNATNIIVTDSSTGDEFTLFKVAGAKGAFVTEVRDEVANLLKDIADKCFDHNRFKSADLNRLLEHCKKFYKVEPLYLWDKLPDCAVLKNPDTNKWFAVIMVVDHSKLIPIKKQYNIPKVGPTEVIVLHTTSDSLNHVLCQYGHYYAYHMSKKYWYTVVPDECIGFVALTSELYDSYALSKKRRR